MAESKRIEAEQLVAIKDLNKGLENALSTLQTFQDVVKETFTVSSKIINSNLGKADNKAIQETVKAIKDSNTAKKIQIELANQALKLEEQQAKVNLAQEKALQIKLKTTIIANREEEKSLKQKEKDRKATEALTSAYKKASKELNDLSAEYKDLAIRQKLGEQLTEQEATQVSKLSARINQLDKALKEADAETGKFNREVGNYKQAIGEAIEKSGAFGGIIGKLTYFVELYESAIEAQKIATEASTVATEASAVAHVENTLAIKAEEGATQKLTLAKRLLNAVTSPTGLIIAAVVAVVALAKAVFDVNQSLQDSLAIGKAFAQDKFWGTGTQFRDLAQATINLRKEIGGLTLELQELKDTEEDLTEISNDQSISFGQRQKAFNEANIARTKFAEKNLELAQRELDIAEKAVKAEESRNGVGEGNALQEFYDKQVEARKKVFEAEDALGDLTRTNAEKERELIQQKTAFEVDLILKKKESANAQGAILEAQIAKETASLEKRRALILRLNAEEQKIQRQQFEIFNRGIDAENVANEKAGEQLKKRVDFQDLVNTKDAVALGRKIELLRQNNLTDEQASQVAKIVAVAQTQQIENMQKLSEQRQKEIEEIKTLNNLTFELYELRSKSQLDLTKEIEEERVSIYKKANEDILEGEKVYNKQLEAERKQSYNEAVDTLEFFYRQKDDLLVESANKERQSVEESVDTDNVKALKIEAIDEKLKLDLSKNERDLYKERKSLSDEEIEQEVRANKRKYEIYIERVEKVAKVAQQITDAVREELEAENERRQEALNKEIDQREKNIDAQQTLFEQGKTNQLQFEKEQLAKAELARKEEAEQNQKRIEALQFTEALFQAYIAELKQPNSNPATAGLKAIAEVTLFKALAKTVVGSFIDGSENIGEDIGMQKYKAHNGTDGYHVPVVALDGREKILNPEQSMLIGDMSNDELANLAYKYNNGSLGTAQNIYNSIDMQPTLAKLNDIHQEIASRPTQIFRVNEFGEIVEGMVTKKYTKNRIISPWRKR
jgi:hypothetical protein